MNLNNNNIVGDEDLLISLANLHSLLTNILALKDIYPNFRARTLSYFERVAIEHILEEAYRFERFRFSYISYNKLFMIIDEICEKYGCRDLADPLQQLILLKIPRLSQDVFK